MPYRTRSPFLMRRRNVDADADADVVGGVATVELVDVVVHPRRVLTLERLSAPRRRHPVVVDVLARRHRVLPDLREEAPRRRHRQRPLRRTAPVVIEGAALDAGRTVGVSGAADGMLEPAGNEAAGEVRNGFAERRRARVGLAVAVAAVPLRFSGRIFLPVDRHRFDSRRGSVVGRPGSKVKKLFTTVSYEFS